MRLIETKKGERREHKKKVYHPKGKSQSLFTTRLKDVIVSELRANARVRRLIVCSLLDLLCGAVCAKVSIDDCNLKEKHQNESRQSHPEKCKRALGMHLVLKVMQFSHVLDQTVHGAHTKTYGKAKHERKVKNTQK